MRGKSLRTVIQGSPQLSTKQWCSPKCEVCDKWFSMTRFFPWNSLTAVKFNNSCMFFRQVVTQHTTYHQIILIKPHTSHHITRSVNVFHSHSRMGRTQTQVTGAGFVHAGQPINSMKALNKSKHRLKPRNHWPNLTRSWHINSTDLWLKGHQTLYTSS